MSACLLDRNVARTPARFAAFAVGCLLSATSLVAGAAERYDLVGKPAVIDVEVGKGRVVAFDFDPIHRYQTESDFRLVWNAILNWNDLPPAAAR